MEQICPPYATGESCPAAFGDSFSAQCKNISLEIFSEISEAAAKHGGEIIFDFGCGTGESTRLIAEQNPGCFIIGMDKSLERIRKAGEKFGRGENYLLLRAEVIDIWRLAIDAGWRLKQHHILYPNPWPKKAHLKRRWHGHPAFADLLKMGGELILRSNWELYLEEFAAAVEIAKKTKAAVQSVSPQKYISCLKKYAESGQDLFEVNVTL